MIASMGGSYQFIQTLLSLFQGPMLTLLLIGALTRRRTASGGLFSQVCFHRGPPGSWIKYALRRIQRFCLLTLWALLNQWADESMNYKRLTYTPW